MNPIVEEGSCGLFGLRKHSMIPEEQFNLQSSPMQKDSSKTQIQQRGELVFNVVAFLSQFNYNC